MYHAIVKRIARTNFERVNAAHFVFGTFLCCLGSFTRIFVRAPSGRQRFNHVNLKLGLTPQTRRPHRPFVRGRAQNSKPHPPTLLLLARVGYRGYA
jgi:hypothetical protein